MPEKKQVPPQPVRSTRRDFLRKSTAAGISATMAANLAVPRAVHAAGNGTIKIGMIGCGGRCSGAAVGALSLGPDVKLAAMADIFEDRMRAKRDYFKAKYPDQFIATDDTCVFGIDGYKRVIEASDAVLIACASKFHPYYAEKAIEAGKHVFIEKPHAIDPAGCKRLERVGKMAQEKGLSLISGHESRYDLGYQEQAKKILGGAIGDIKAIQSMFLRNPYRLVDRDPKLSETEYQFSNWYHFCWLSGDDVTQSLVHNLDRMRWILGEENPISCFGLGGRSSGFGEVYGDMFDHGTVVYEMPGGARITAMTQTRLGCYGKWDDIVMGTKGTCYWTRCRIEGDTNWRYRGPKNNLHVAEQQLLVDSIRSGKPINHQDTMIDSTRMAIMGQIAVYTGKPITWEQMMAADFEFGPKVEEVTLDMAPPTVMDKTGNYPLPIPGITQFL